MSEQMRGKQLTLGQKAQFLRIKQRRMSDDLFKVKVNDLWSQWIEKNTYIV